MWILRYGIQSDGEMRGAGCDERLISGCGVWCGSGLHIR